jgi:hypothetical protein
MLSVVRRTLLSLLAGLALDLLVLVIAVTIAGLVSAIIGYKTLVFGFGYLLFSAIILGGFVFLAMIVGRFLLSRLRRA